jgi:hypothetical protein
MLFLFSVAVGTKLYVYGGNDGSNDLDDVFVLDTGMFL